MTHKHVQNAASGVGERVGAELARQLQQPLDPGLYLVATPIGNLGDMTLRAVATLARADLICCEDTRHSGVLLAHFGIDRPLRPYHEHNAAAERPRILAALAGQKIVALITDAGTPLISDPGFKLVRAATEQGFHVTALPGASAVLAALGLSGLPSDCFLFAGFLPAKEAARRSRLAELSRTPATLIFFEAPTRVAASLATIADVYPQRAVTVARELTKRFEDVRRGTAEALAAWAASGAEIKGEVVLVVAPPIAREVADDEIEAALQRALCDMKLRDAARQVADTLGVSRTRAYDIGLKLKAGAR